MAQYEKFTVAALDPKDGTADYDFASDFVRKLDETADYYERRMSRLAEMRAVAGKLPREEDLPDDAVIMFTKSFGSFNDHVFTYAAMRLAHNGDWYITGTRDNRSPMTYNALLDFILKGGRVHEVWLATEWQQLV